MELLMAKIGPKDWGPKLEARWRDFEFAGLSLQVTRANVSGLRPGKEGYTVSVVSPNGSVYNYIAEIASADKYLGTGLLNAALSALADILEVKDDFAAYRDALMDLYQGSEYAQFQALQARQAARPFRRRMVEDAMDEVAAELRKVPSVQRQLKRGWEDLMRRRGQQP